MDDVSLYFHIPFCRKKCPYCHFFVVPDRESLHASFIEALLAEWRLQQHLLQNKRIVSIYFGGGTPTRLPPKTLEPLLSQLFSSGIDIAPQCEVTLEANPEDVTLERMKAYKALGINRVSIGVQSLDSQELTLLGRAHTHHRAKEAILMTYQAGIHNLSIDLMFELPSQTLASWHHTLLAIEDLPITHLSLYNLTFEPNTVFFKNKERLSQGLPNASTRLAMLNAAVERLPMYGLKRYEISAFARPGYASHHNTGYWQGRPFLGFGPSAFSYWEQERFSNLPQLHRYISQLSTGESIEHFREKLPIEAQVRELLAIQLRLLSGVDLDDFCARHGPFSDPLHTTITQLIEKGWLGQMSNRLFLTEEGQLFYDSVAVELI